MVVRDQPTVINEAISTGVVRIELLGDKDVARTHIHEARKLTSQLRAMYGVTERIANGEPGGFYQHTVELQDSTVMIATTNDGQDSVSILSVGGVEEEVVEEVEEKLPKVSYKPGLWVGARYISGGKRSNDDRNSEIHLCLWEPVEGDEFNILSNRDLLWPITHTDPLNEDADTFPLRKNADIEDTRFEVLEEYTDSDDVEWDVVIRSTETPRSARYYVKTAIKGDDCIRTTDTIIEVKVIITDDFGVNKTTKKEEIAIPSVTNYKYGLIPKGWFGDQVGDLEPCSDCSRSADDYGENPHGDHWWQGGATAYVPSIQINIDQKDLIRPSIVVDGDGELRTPTGFNFDDSFASRTDRCPACETDSTILFGTISTLQVNDRTERPEGTWPADILCGDEGPYFRRFQSLKKSEMPTGFSQAITTAAGIPAIAQVEGFSSGKSFSMNIRWDANPTNPPLELNTSDTGVSTTGGACFAGAWIFTTPTNYGLFSGAWEFMTATYGYVQSDSYLLAHTITRSSKINSTNDGFVESYGGYTPVSVAQWTAFGGGTFGIPRTVSTTCTKVMFLND